MLQEPDRARPAGTTAPLVRGVPPCPAQCLTHAALTAPDLSHRSAVFRHVLQRALRQVRHASALRLLPVMGAQLGVQEEGHHAGNPELLR